MFALLLATAAALTGLVSAQNGTVGSFTGPYTQGDTIDPNTVDPEVRLAWCTSQKSNCLMICAGPDADPGDAIPNTCDDSTLTFECVCTNGNTPNISAYTDTIPYHICQEWEDQCTAAQNGDLTGLTACQAVSCGGLNASMANAAGGSSSSASASSSAPSSTASSTSGGGSSGSSSGDSSASSSAAAASETGNTATTIGMNYGTGILMGGLFAVFGLAL